MHAPTPLFTLLFTPEAISRLLKLITFGRLEVKGWTLRLARELGCPLVSSREAKVAVHFRESYRVSDIFVTKGALGERIEHF